MRLLSLAFLTGVALANPFNVEKRQLNPEQVAACSATYTGQCTNARLMASATGFCAGLGFDTNTQTVRRTATVRQTVVSTRTVYTSTTTLTARPVTVRNTATRTATTTTTRTINLSTTRTRNVIARVTGTIQSCPGYEPPQTAQDPEVTNPNPAGTTTTTTSGAATTSTTTSGAATTSTTTSALTTTTSSATTSTTTTTPAAATTPALKARQAGAPQPACLRATNAPETTSACKCVIPVPTATRTRTSTRTVTSTRTMSTTTSMVSTTTTTPTVTVTMTRTNTVTNTRTTTRRETMTVTSTSSSTIAYELAATPAAFYIVDDKMAFAEWPANNNDFYYNVQYDFNQTDDEFAPTVFSLSGFHGDELRVETGPSEGARVVAHEYNGPGWQMLALEDSTDAEYPVCQIEATADGQCPLSCRMGNNVVNGRTADGLWTLLPNGTAGAFVNFVMEASDVANTEGVTEEPRVAKR